MLEAARAGDLRFLYVVGADPAADYPDARAWEEARRRLEGLVVHEVFMTRTAASADVVLPALTYAEKAGTVGNIEGRIQRQDQARLGPGAARSDGQIFTELAARLDAPLAFASWADVSAEIARVVPMYAGIEDLREILQEQSMAVSALPHRHQSAASEHRAIFDAIVRGDAEDAAEAVARHLGAVEIAVSQLTRESVVLMDADFLFGDADLHLNLTNDRSILDLLPHIESLDSKLVDQVVGKHSSGVHLLSRPPRPEQADAINDGDVRTLVSSLGLLYEWVVLDTPPSYDDRMLAVLDTADVYVVVVAGLSPGHKRWRSACHLQTRAAGRASH